MYLLCANAGDQGAAPGSNGGGGGLSRCKLDFALSGGETVANLREKVTGVVQLSSFNLIYCGKILDDDKRTLSSYGISSNSSIQVVIIIVP